MQNSVEICQMTSEMLESVTYVHLQAFKGAMNTRLGKRYLRKFFDWFIEVKGGIALVAILQNGDQEQIVGYVVGAPLGYGKNMNRDLLWVTGLNVLIRPWVFLSKDFRNILKVRLKALICSSSHDQISEIDLPAPVQSLVGIGVMPNQQGNSIGKELLCAFEKRARGFNVRSLRLSVYPENSAACRVYEKCRWLRSENLVVPGKSISYYKTL